MPWTEWNQIKGEILEMWDLVRVSVSINPLTSNILGYSDKTKI